LLLCGERWREDVPDEDAGESRSLLSVGAEKLFRALADESVMDEPMRNSVYTIFSLQMESLTEIQSSPPSEQLVHLHRHIRRYLSHLPRLAFHRFTRTMFMNDLHLRLQEQIQPRIQRPILLASPGGPHCRLLRTTHSSSGTAKLRCDVKKPSGSCVSLK
jgi:hypothetical protein